MLQTERSHTEQQYLRLALAGSHLLLPTQDVAGLEPADAIAQPAARADGAGTLTHAGQRYVVYALDAALRPRTNTDGARSVALLRTQPAFGICCTAAEVIAGDALERVPVPECMFDDQRWFEHVARLGNDVLCVLDGPALARLLARGAA